MTYLIVLYVAAGTATALFFLWRNLHLFDAMPPKELFGFIVIGMLVFIFWWFWLPMFFFSYLGRLEFPERDET